MNNKQRCFLVARKREIPIDVVYDLLASMGCPPTLSQVPAKRYTYEGGGSSGTAICSSRVKGDYREITREQASAVVDRLCTLSKPIRSEVTLSPEYIRAAERLFQLLDESRSQWKDTVNRPSSFSPNDDFAAGNPAFAAIRSRVNEELQYELSDRQASWAVLSFLNNTWTNYTTVGPRLGAHSP